MGGVLDVAGKAMNRALKYPFSRVLTDEEQALSDYLRKTWDPIGLGDDGPIDEYDSYALPLLTAVKVLKVSPFHRSMDSALGIAKIAMRLTAIRCGDIGLQQNDETIDADLAVAMHIFENFR